MVDVTHQDGNKRNADGLINKSFNDVNMSGQNIIVSSVNPTLITSNQKNVNHLQQQQQPQQHQHFNVVHHQNSLQTKQQPQQFSLVHHQNLQKPILINASSGSGSVLQQQTNAGSNKIILTPASQSISGNVYVGTHGKLVIPSNNNNQSIVIDSSKVTSSNNMQQQKNQTTHQQRVKIDNKVNMLLDSSESKNIIYAKYNKNSNKLIHTVANLIPVHATTKNCNIQQITKQISSNPSIINANNRRTQQQLRQQQQINTGSTITTANFLNTATTSKIQQPNNGNDNNPR